MTTPQPRAPWWVYNRLESVCLGDAASPVGSLYVGMLVHLVRGEGAGQIRIITDYHSPTRTAKVQPTWTTPPDETTQYSVITNGFGAP